MAVFTKQVLADALKRMLSTRPLDKITVKDLVAECQVNRQTFYYHFQDIYDLLGWIYKTEAIDTIQNSKTYATWQQGLTIIFQYVQDHKELCMNTYRSLGREHLERFLNGVLNELLGDVIAEIAAPYSISDTNQTFLAKFYSYAFAGTLLEWIKNGMKTPSSEIVDQISHTVEGNILAAVQRFQTL